MAFHVEENLLNDLKSKIDVHDPFGYNDLRIGLKKALLWLRDESPGRSIRLKHLHLYTLALLTWAPSTLINWDQTNANPDLKLGRTRRGFLLLPDIASFYAKAQKPSMRQRVYGPKTPRFMLTRMEKQPQKPWPTDRICSFKSESRVFGSPTLDAVLKKSPLDKEMMHWLKSRPAVFLGMWDQ
ncbi:hypothetical protein NE237_000857 [Protea cynaroides]|uniref:ATXR3 C-terminal domain-containing protein n=1 Tax=Protea cynaroides TaxID=273540 RepID=A0A9Q0KSX4_9MAGN|nr:hypothetical protein NE237_000857 [Protea cynaroides]